MNHENIISKLTLEEKIAMIHAAGLFRSGAVKRLRYSFACYVGWTKRSSSGI